MCWCPNLGNMRSDREKRYRQTPGFERTDDDSETSGMRISIPNITSNGTYTPLLLPVPQTIRRLVEFLDGSTGTAVLTGAGVSVDSGIRAYRGDQGRYINPNYK